MQSVEEAIQTLVRAGITISVTIPEAHLSLGETARRLDCSVSWVRKHKAAFPRMWRMPGGELRIPVADITVLAANNRIRRK